MHIFLDCNNNIFVYSTRKVNMFISVYIGFLFNDTHANVLRPVYIETF